MSKKDNRTNLPLGEELEIFGEHKSREQLLAEEKERKIAQREALRAEMRRRREEEKAGGTTPARRKDIIVITAVLVAMVLIMVLALGYSFFRAAEKERWSIDPTRGHYEAADAVPDASSDGPMANVREAYFTKNGHLCVELIIGNGTAKMQEIQAVDVAVFDYDEDTMIAGGKATLAEPLTIAVADTALHTFYISPEHIQCADDAQLPEVLTFTISIDHAAVEAE